jgi:signal peptide peptidase-like protein 2B
VSYNFGFDLIVGSPKTYFIVSVISYGLGLIVTFIALALMATGQPALLYLVPFTLLPTLFVALKRKEVKRLWEGPDYGVRSVFFLLYKFLIYSDPMITS